MESDEYENNWIYLKLCIEPTVLEGLRFAKDLILINVILRLILQYQNIPSNFRHFFSIVTGIILLYINVGFTLVWPLGVTICSYALISLLFTLKLRYRSLILSLSIILFLLSCEIQINDPTMWQQIRGIQMIVAMKTISVAIEMERGVYKHILNPLEFGGYILCPANCILGPWICYSDYLKSLEKKILSRKWIKVIVINVGKAIGFLVLSNCIVPWYIDDTHKWLAAYRDAQAFRMSHYFVSSLSVVSMISAGFGFTNNGQSEVSITMPMYIELPRSLVQVVVYWNIPMHRWLKIYVFKNFQCFGQFSAIFVTYVVSSILHGLNFQLSAVLMSIGIFSYVEYNLRLKISAALEVCCLANPCLKQCSHIYKSNSFLCKSLNAIFSVVAMVHLAYLGVMFEASFAVQESGYSYQHTLSKWENLDYFSHGYTAFLFVINHLL